MENILFHPILVHYPIAFYFLELLLIFLWRVKRDDQFHRFARFAFRLGYGFMLAAMVAGYYDAGGVVPKVRTHFFSALSVFMIYTARAFYWRLGNKGQTEYFRIQAAGALIGNLLVALTGYFGGEIVFGS